MNDKCGNPIYDGDEVFLDGLLRGPIAGRIYYRMHKGQRTAFFVWSLIPLLNSNTEDGIESLLELDDSPQIVEGLSHRLEQIDCIPF